MNSGKKITSEIGEGIEKKKESGKGQSITQYKAHQPFKVDTSKFA